MVEIPLPYKGRPLFVRYDNGKVYISIHDRWYLNILNKFKQRIFKSHPDRNVKRGQGVSTTKRLLKARLVFQEREKEWYAFFGLEPPRKDGNKFQPIKDRRHYGQPCVYSLQARNSRNNSGVP